MEQPAEMFTSPMEVTTEQIQKYLDENKQLIMAILESKNLGKSAEGNLYQTRLQNNLMFLARIADAQPQAPRIPSQMPAESSEQQEHYLHPSQAAISGHQGFSALKSPFPLNNQQQQQHQLPYVQQQQLIQGHMGMRPGTSSGMYQAMQTEPRSSFTNMHGIEPDFMEAGAGDGLGRSASRYNSGSTEA